MHHLTQTTVHFILYNCDLLFCGCLRPHPPMHLMVSETGCFITNSSRLTRKHQILPHEYNLTVTIMFQQATFYNYSVAVNPRISESSARRKQVGNAKLVSNWLSNILGMCHQAKPKNQSIS